MLVETRLMHLRLKPLMSASLAASLATPSTAFGTHLTLTLLSAPITEHVLKSALETVQAAFMGKKSALPKMAQVL